MHSTVIKHKQNFSSFSVTFQLKVIVTLTLTSKSNKIERGLLLGMANLHTKYGVPRPKCSSVIERKPSFTSQGHYDLDL